MTRILSLLCGLALAAPAAAQDRPAPRPPQPERPKADAGRDLQVEVERLRAQVRELEARLAKQKDGDRRPEGPKGPPEPGRKFDGPPKGDDRPAPRDVAPMPRPKDGERGPAPKADGPMGGRGFGPPMGPMGPGFGRGFGPGAPVGVNVPVACTAGVVPSGKPKFSTPASEVVGLYAPLFPLNPRTKSM